MQKIFYSNGDDFSACYEAEAWCEARGITVGAPERNQPRGLMVEFCAIAKWSNLRPHERNALDGRMTGDMLRGPVTIELPLDESDYPTMPDEEDGL
ncbi:MAG: hypothetical protein JWP38_3678 [Herbaspirillum sp.]|nr:hypothetical protein [Herbaspirillum sp.]